MVVLVVVEGERELAVVIVRVCTLVACMWICIQPR